jgi:hypothetical protein
MPRVITTTRSPSAVNSSASRTAIPSDPVMMTDPTTPMRFAAQERTPAGSLADFETQVAATTRRRRPQPKRGGRQSTA